MKGLLGWAKNTRAWRETRAALQLRRYDALLQRITQAPRAYDLPQLQADLARIRPSRRPLPERPVVVGFGANDWEQNSLWPAFNATSSFHLMDKWAPRRNVRWPLDEQRRRLGGELLKFVDEVQRSTPVDMVFMYAGGSEVDAVTIEELGRRGIWTSMMSLDDKQLLPGPRVDGIENWQLDVTRAVDIYWTTWRAALDWLAAEGARPWYAPEGADADRFAPVSVQRDIDVLWLGRSYGPRGALVEFLRARGLRVHAAGPGWENGPVSFEEMIKLFSRAHIVLGMGGVGQTDAIKHLKGRDFEVPMCGTVYLTSFNPELTDWFDIGREIVCYSSAAECVETIAWLLRRPEAAQKIRDAARARCLADHTWSRRITDIFGLMRG